MNKIIPLFEQFASIFEPWDRQ